MDLQLKGKVALVTGASRGLGYAAALLLAEEGARVAINSRSAPALAEARQSLGKATGAEVLDIPADIVALESPEAVVRAVVDRFGGLDILIANAGGPPAGSFESLSDADWQRALDLSFLSQMRLIRAALPHLRRSQTPSVLTLTSYSVKQPIPNLVLSNSVRLATIGLTKSLALELGREGIRFNSILPGWTETERVGHLFEDRAQRSGASVSAEMDKQTAEIALGRMGTPREFANAAIFLVSPAASYITGLMMPVDGGVIKSTL